MAAFNLTAQLQLQAPNNINQVVSAIKKQLAPIGIQVNIAGNSRTIAQINKELQNTSKYAKSSARSVGELNRTLQESARRFSVITLATGTLLSFAAALKNSVREAIDFEKSLVNLSQVTGKTTDQLKPLADEVTRLSVTLGASSKDLIDAAQTLAQAGFSAEKTKKALDILAQTTLASSFGNIKDTTEGVISALAQFTSTSASTATQIEFLETTLNSINAVSKAFAVESSDLITVIRRTGGVFAAAGGSVEELIALFTSVRATTRESAETIATGLRTIFTRIQRPETIELLKGLNIQLQDSEGKFVGAYEAVKRLAQGLSALDPRDVRFASIIEELGGFRQVGKVIPLLKQFTVAQDALNVAQAASGSIAEDARIAQQSLANQISKLREEFDALIRRFAASETFRSIAGGALELARAFIKVADSLEPLLPLITSLFALKIGSGLAPAIASFVGIGAGAGGRGGSGKISKFARGGMVPGSGNRDTVPAMLTPGEFVIRKSSVNKLGAGTLHAMNQNKYAKGGLVIQKTDDSQFAGLFARPRGEDQSGKKISIASDKGYETAGGKTKEILAYVGAPKSYFISGTDESQFTNQATSLLNDSINNLVGKIAPASKNKATQGILTDIGIDDIAGKIFEGVTRTIIGDFERGGGSQQGFDIPVGKDAKIYQELGNLFNPSTPPTPLPNNVNYDNKLTENRSNRASLLKKAVNKKLLLEPPQQIVSFSSDLSTDKILAQQPTKDNKDLARKRFEELQQARENIANNLDAETAKIISTRLTLQSQKLQKYIDSATKPTKKAASGGYISGSDTVPALLTPGEFVVNKKSASRIGYGNLHRMNKSGVQGFASGGIVGVQKFATGAKVEAAKSLVGPQAFQPVFPGLDDFTDDLKKLNIAFKTVGIESKDATATLKYLVKQIKDGVSPSDAYSKALEKLNKTLSTRDIKAEKSQQTQQTFGNIQQGAQQIQSIANTAQSFVFLGTAVASVTSQLSSLDDVTKRAINETAGFAAAIVGIAGTVVSTFSSLVDTISSNIVSAAKIVEAQASLTAASADETEAASSLAAAGKSTKSMGIFTQALGGISAGLVATLGVVSYWKYQQSVAASQAEILGRSFESAIEKLNSTGNIDRSSAIQSKQDQLMRQAESNAAASAQKTAALWGVTATALVGTLLTFTGVGAPLGIALTALAAGIAAAAGGYSEYDSEIQKSKQELQNLNSSIEKTANGIFSLSESSFRFNDALKQIDLNKLLTPEQKQTRRIQATGDLLSGLGASIQNKNRGSLPTSSNDDLITSQKQSLDTIRYIADSYGMSLQEAQTKEGQSKMNELDASLVNLEMQKLEKYMQNLGSAVQAARDNFYEVASTQLGVENLQEVLSDGSTLIGQAYSQYKTALELEARSRIEEAKQRAFNATQNVQSATEASKKALEAAGGNRDDAEYQQSQVRLQRAIQAEADARDAIDKEYNRSEKVMKDFNDSVIQANQNQIDANKARVDEYNALQKLRAEIERSQRIGTVLDSFITSLDNAAVSIENQTSIFGGGKFKITPPKISEIGETTNIQNRAKFEKEVDVVASRFGAAGTELGNKVKEQSALYDKAIKELQLAPQTVKNPEETIKGILDAAGVSIATVGEEEFKRIFNELRKKLNTTGQVEITKEDAEKILDPLKKSLEESAKRLKQFEEIYGKELENYSKYISSLEEYRSKELEGLARISSTIMRAYDIRSKARGKEPDIGVRETLRTQAAQTQLNASGVGARVGDVAGIGAARKSAMAELESIRKQLDALRSGGGPKDGEARLRATQGLIAAESKQRAILEATNKELERLADQSERVADIQAEIEKEQRKRGQIKEFVKSFVVGGEEERGSTLDAIQGLNVAFAQGTLQGLDEDVRKGVVGLLDQLSEVEIPGAGGAKGKQILDEFILRDAFAMGFPPEWVQALRGATSKEEKLVNAIDQLTAQMIEAARVRAQMPNVPQLVQVINIKDLATAAAIPPSVPQEAKPKTKADLTPFTPEAGESAPKETVGTISAVMRRLIDLVNEIESTFSTRPYVPPASGTGASGRARGGLIYRVGGGSIFQSKGTDTVPAMLTPGEFVVRKSAVDKIGVQALESINQGNISAQGYAEGGTVKRYNIGLNAIEEPNKGEEPQQYISPYQIQDQQGKEKQSQLYGRVQTFDSKGKPLTDENGKPIYKESENFGVGEGGGFFDFSGAKKEKQNAAEYRNPYWQDDKSGWRTSPGITDPQGKNLIDKSGSPISPAELVSWYKSNFGFDVNPQAGNPSAPENDLSSGSGVAFSEAVNEWVKRQLVQEEARKIAPDTQSMPGWDVYGPNTNLNNVDQDQLLAAYQQVAEQRKQEEAELAPEREARKRQTTMAQLETDLRNDVSYASVMANAMGDTIGYGRDALFGDYFKEQEEAKKANQNLGGVDSNPLKAGVDAGYESIYRNMDEAGKAAQSGLYGAGNFANQAATGALYDKQFRAWRDSLPLMERTDTQENLVKRFEDEYWNSRKGLVGTDTETARKLQTEQYVKSKEYGQHWLMAMELATIPISAPVSAALGVGSAVAALADNEKSGWEKGLAVGFAALPGAGLAAKYIGKTAVGTALKTGVANSFVGRGAKAVGNAFNKYDEFMSKDWEEVLASGVNAGIGGGKKLATGGKNLIQGGYQGAKSGVQQGYQGVKTSVNNIGGMFGKSAQAEESAALKAFRSGNWGAAQAEESASLAAFRSGNWGGTVNASAQAEESASLAAFRSGNWVTPPANRPIGPQGFYAGVTPPAAPAPPPMPTLANLPTKNTTLAPQGWKMGATPPPAPAPPAMPTLANLPTKNVIPPTPPVRPPMSVVPPAMPPKLPAPPTPMPVVPPAIPPKLPALPQMPVIPPKQPISSTIPGSLQSQGTKISFNKAAKSGQELKLNTFKEQLINQSDDVTKGLMYKQAVSRVELGQINAMNAIQKRAKNVLPQNISKIDEVVLGEGKVGSYGSFSPVDRSIRLSSDVFQNNSKAASTIEHEFIHAIDWNSKLQRMGDKANWESMADVIDSLGGQSKVLQFLDQWDEAAKLASQKEGVHIAYSARDMMKTPAEIPTSLSDLEIQAPEIFAKYPVFEEMFRNYVQNVMRLNTGGLVSYFADGGSIFKPKGTDTVPAMLTPGEFVIRKSAVDKIGTGALEAINQGNGTVYASNGGVIYAQKGRSVPKEDNSYPFLRAVDTAVGSLYNMPDPFGEDGLFGDYSKQQEEAKKANQNSGGLDPNPMKAGFDAAYDNFYGNINDIGKGASDFINQQLSRGFVSDFLQPDAKKSVDQIKKEKGYTTTFKNENGEPITLAPTASGGLDEYALDQLFLQQARQQKLDMEASIQGTQKLRPEVYGNDPIIKDEMLYGSRGTNFAMTGNRYYKVDALENIPWINDRDVQEVQAFNAAGLASTIHSSTGQTFAQMARQTQDQINKDRLDIWYKSALIDTGQYENLSESGYDMSNFKFDEAMQQYRNEAMIQSMKGPEQATENPIFEQMRKSRAESDAQQAGYEAQTNARNEQMAREAAAARGEEYVSPNDFVPNPRADTYVAEKDIFGKPTGEVTVQKFWSMQEAKRKEREQQQAAAAAEFAASDEGQRRQAKKQETEDAWARLRESRQKGANPAGADSRGINFMGVPIGPQATAGQAGPNGQPADAMALPGGAVNIPQPSNSANILSGEQYKNVISSIATGSDPETIFKMLQDGGILTDDPSKYIEQIKSGAANYGELINSFPITDQTGAILDNLISLAEQGYITKADISGLTIKTPSISTDINGDNKEAQYNDLINQWTSMVTAFSSIINAPLERMGEGVARNILNLKGIQPVEDQVDTAIQQIQNQSKEWEFLIPSSRGLASTGDYAAAINVLNTNGAFDVSSGVQEQDKQGYIENLQRLMMNKGGSIPRFAGGGSIDTVPAMLTPGEFVMNAGAVQKYGLDTMHSINRGQLKGFNRGGFVGGVSYLQNGGQAMGGSVSFDISELDRTFNTFVTNISPIFDRMLGTMDGFTSSLDQLANKFSGLEVKHTVNVEGLISIGGLNIDNIATEITQSISNVVSEEVKKQLNDPSRGQSANGP